ncbi:MAG: hypothetical protein JXC32_20190 [Anaerolineae bacterium]|nr:hypothetical protein [Anaerolineae bacterium]
MQAFNRTTQDELQRILDSDQDDMQRFVAAFDWLTRRIIEVAENEIELARAMRDQETVVKQQIKLQTLRTARDVFQTCYLRVTGARNRLWEV